MGWVTFPSADAGVGRNYEQAVLGTSGGQTVNTILGVLSSIACSFEVAVGVQTWSQSRECAAYAPCRQDTFAALTRCIQWLRELNRPLGQYYFVMTIYMTNQAFCDLIMSDTLVWQGQGWCRLYADLQEESKDGEGNLCYKVLLQRSELPQLHPEDYQRAPP